MSVRFVGSSSFNDGALLSHRVTCEKCSYFTYTPGLLAGHMADAHPGLSPAVVRFREAAAKGQGVSTEAARARRGLS